MFNIVLGGSMVLLAFYLVTIRKESHELFGFLLIPATAMAALAATAAGPVPDRFRSRAAVDDHRAFHRCWRVCWC